MTMNKSLLAKIVVTVAVMLSPLLDTTSARAKNNRGIEVKFTKWLVNSSGLTPPQFGPLLEGDTAGDVPGMFEGSVIQVVPQTLSDGTTIKRLEARYTVIANNPRHSFSMLIHGRQSSTLRGVLSGIVTDGWQSGSEVHVEFQGSPCGKGSGVCFDGTIRIMQDRDDD
jgi:hypothetical protein